jgi:hypothetical protein
MMLLLLNWHILLLSFTDEINNTAISSDWVPMIAKAARIVYSIPDECPVLHGGVVFDEGLVLLLVEPTTI